MRFDYITSKHIILFGRFKLKECIVKELPDGHRALEPPDTISNSEVKRCIADGSVGSPHVRVGHYQALFFIQIFLYIFSLNRTIFYLLKF